VCNNDIAAVTTNFIRARDPVRIGDIPNPIRQLPYFRWRRQSELCCECHPIEHPTYRPIATDIVISDVRSIIVIDHPFPSIIIAFMGCTRGSRQTVVMCNIDTSDTDRVRASDTVRICHIVNPIRQLPVFLRSHADALG
jgi:hypothetical protein